MTEKQRPVLFPRQKPSNDDLQQILKFLQYSFERAAKGGLEYGVASGFELEIDPNNSSKIRVKEGRAYDQNGRVIFRTASEALTGYSLPTNNPSDIYYVKLSSVLSDSEVKSHPEKSSLTYNTRRYFGSSIGFSLTGVASPSISLGTVEIEDDLSLVLNVNKSVRDYIHRLRLGSGSVNDNAHGISKDDIPNFSDLLEEHRNLEHPDFIYGELSSLSASISGNVALSITNVQSDDICFFKGKRYTSLDVSNVNGVVVWNLEGSSAGTYYIYVDSNGILQKQLNGVSPDGKIWQVDRATDKTLSNLIDYRNFSPFTTKDIRHNIGSLPSLFADKSLVDNKPGYRQSDINEYLYNDAISALKGVLIGTSLVNPDANGLLSILGSKGISVTTPGSNKVDIDLPTSVAGGFKVDYKEFLGSQMTQSEAKFGNFTTKYSLIDNVNYPVFVLMYGKMGKNIKGVEHTDPSVTVSLDGTFQQVDQLNPSSNASIGTLCLGIGYIGDSSTILQNAIAFFNQHWQLASFDGAGSSRYRGLMMPMIGIDRPYTPLPNWTARHYLGTFAYKMKWKPVTTNGGGTIAPAGAMQGTSAYSYIASLLIESGSLKFQIQRATGAVLDAPSSAEDQAALNELALRFVIVTTGVSV